jgi:DNA repair photolyase
MKPIYKPKGAAAEYGEYALNIYTGCPHGCYYCYVPAVLRCEKGKFHNHVEPRKDIVRETEKQIIKENITGQTIHICFSCDPYPTGYDTSVTREIIALLKKYGNHVQILTKGDGRRDFDLLDGYDWYGVTLDGGNIPRKGSSVADLKLQLKEAHDKGINTWVSFEPVLDCDNVLAMIPEVAEYTNKIAIGKLNHIRANIAWNDFRDKAEQLSKALVQENNSLNEVYIKESLRKSR